MTLVDRMERVQGQLALIPEVDIKSAAHFPPVSSAQVDRVEQELGYAFPSTVREVYEREAGGTRFLWTAPPHTFGPECKYGELSLIPPDQVVRHFEGLRSLAEDARREYDLDAFPGWAAIARDWPFWIPIFAFGNGDYFCLDVRKGNGDYPVVFLVHDTMWDEPLVHGQQVATSFSNLLERWSEIAFLFRFEWGDSLDAGGIDINAAVYRRLRQRLWGSE